MNIIKTLIGACLIAGTYFAIRTFYFKPQYNEGESAPAFSGTLADGATFDLEQLKGKYVLIDFWGSWCGPCLKDKPLLKVLYEGYHKAIFHDASGFEIVSIAVEESDARWRAAMSRYPVPWSYHLLDTVSSLQFFDGEYTTLYGVKRLPSSFLLNPEGKIISVTPGMKEIDQRLHPLRKK